MREHLVLKELVFKERKLLTKIIDHLQIINDSKYFLKLGHKSMLDYCVKELKYSESAAFRRLKLIKLTKELPDVKDQLEKGELTLTQAVQAQTYFDQTHTKDKKLKKDVINKILGESSKKSEQTIRESLNLPAKKFKIDLEVKEKTLDKWKELKERSIHLALTDAELLDQLIEERLNKIKKESAKPTQTKSKLQRAITVKTKRFLMKRAQHRCEFINNGTGEICSSHFGLEIDHIRPINQGGQSNLENLRVLCRHHNQR